jgi:hypothetical protein
MPQVVANDGDIDTRLSQRDGATVTHDVWGHTSSQELRFSFSGSMHVFTQQVGDTVSRHRLSLSVFENMFVFPSADELL